MTDETRRREGSCYCGAVRFCVRDPAKFVAHDHCSICRRVAGAAYVTWCGFREEQLEITSGADVLTTHASSEGATRQFCSRCGSHLFFRGARWPGEVHVTLATLKDVEGLTPQAHVYVSDRAPWVAIHDDLPKLGGATGIQKLEG